MADTRDQQAAEPAQAVRAGIVRHENFESWYANNVQLHPSEWDLKMVFGEIDWPQTGTVIQQHTAITMGWLQAKLLLYFLTFHVSLYEMTHGPIGVPPDVMPPEPVPPTGDLADNLLAKQVYEYAKKMRADFVASFKK